MRLLGTLAAHLELCPRYRVVRSKIHVPRLAFYVPISAIRALAPISHGLLAAIPTILVFLALKKHFISGLSLGASKG